MYRNNRLTNISKITISITMLCALISMFYSNVLKIGLWSDFTDFFVNRQLELNSLEKQDLIKKGWVYYNLGEYEKAKSIMEEITEHRQNLSAVYCLALIDLEHKRYEDSIKKLKMVSSKSPDHTPTYLALGKAYYYLGDYAKAKNMFLKVINKDPDIQEAYTWLRKAE